MEWDANAYNEHSRIQTEIGHLLIKALNPQHSERILDVGCGTGTLTRYIGQLTFPGEVVGIDADLHMVEFARRTLQSITTPGNPLNIQFIQLNASTMVYHEEFDAIFSNFVLHWIKELPAFFNHAFQALTPGGRVAIASIYDDKFLTSATTLSKFVQIELHHLQTFIQNGHHQSILPTAELMQFITQVQNQMVYRTYDVKTLKCMLGDAGFTDITSEVSHFQEPFADPDRYLDYRQSNLWVYFLSFFPPQFRPQVSKKLRELILTEWHSLPTKEREELIVEHWPVVLLSATKPKNED